jgi:uncharacterized protein
VQLISRNLPDLIVLAAVFLTQAWGICWILQRRATPDWLRRLIATLLVLSAGAAILGFLLHYHRVARWFPPWWWIWGRAVLISWAVLSVLVLAAWGLSRLLPQPRSEHSPARRNFLRFVNAVVLAAPAAATGYGMFVERSRLRLREQDIPIRGLPADLDGLRLVQVTDIHLSAFLHEAELERAIAMANETKAHIALMTGDLISTAGDPLDACLKHVAKLRADAGIFGCMGNHEIYAMAEDYTAAEGARLGIRFLRHSAVPLRFGSSVLNLAGVDYQRLNKPYLAGMERCVRPGALNVLLSHNPDVFPVAARQGYQLTLSGHTHGGQVSVEILHQNLSVARFFTPYVDGLYRRGASSIFVSRGIGTIAVPVRLGSIPEVALVRLCRA